MAEEKPGRAVLLLCATSGLTVVLHFLPVPRSGRFGQAAFDAGHAALFGLYALIVLGVLRALPALAEARRARVYLFALAIALATSAFAESMQYLGGRDADVTDVLRSTAGAAAALLGAAACDAQRGFGRPASRLVQGLMIASAVALLLMTSATVLCVAAAYVHRWAVFPRIADFQSCWGVRFLETHDATLVVTDLPEVWDPSGRERAAYVTFGRATYPGFSVQEPYPRWTGYDRLVLEVYSDLATPVELVLRIHDHEHVDSYADRFNRSLRIEPGRNRISIPLVEVRVAPRGREMDMSRIAGLALFAVAPSEAFTLYVDALRLERD